jgi:hypothetical protein
MDVRMFVNSNVRNAYIWVLCAIFAETPQIRQTDRKLKLNLFIICTHNIFAQTI